MCICVVVFDVLMGEGRLLRFPQRPNGVIYNEVVVEWKRVN